MTFKEQFHILRKNYLKVTQDEMSAATGISKSHISKIESGAYTPSYHFLMKLLTIYNVSLDWLFTGKGSIFLSGDPQLEEFKKFLTNASDRDIKIVFDLINSLNITD